MRIVCLPDEVRAALAAGITEPRPLKLCISELCLPCVDCFHTASPLVGTGMTSGSPQFASNGSAEITSPNQ